MGTNDRNDLAALYREIHELTHAACDTCTNVARQLPNRCCDPVACANAKRWMDLKGIYAEATGHPTLPYMGKNGRCILDITMKPLCTLHMCGDPYANPRYLELKNRIIELEGEDWKKYVG